MAGIISSFGAPHRASRLSHNWEDLIGFNMIFICEDFEDILESNVVTMGPHVFEVSIEVNYMLE